MEMKQGNFNTDSQIEYKFSKVIKGILGNYFINKDITQDLKQGTDFSVFTVTPFRVAVRLRRFDQYIKPGYKDEFTIRYSRPSGVKTEYQKINEGLVDYILYGFIDKEERKIIQYFIGDLRIFRTMKLKPLAIKPNNPHDSDLAIYKINQYPKTFILHFYTANG